MNNPQPQQLQHPALDADRVQPQPAEPTSNATNEQQQAEYLAAYQLQLRRMSCPGCGEGEPSF